MASSSFSDDVRSVLMDTMNLPADFLNYLIQNQALNPVPLAKTSGQRIAIGTRTANVTTTGTTFATGADLLSSALEFTASGSNSYIVRAQALAWQNSVATNENFAHLNLDGTDGGIMAATHIPAASNLEPLSGIAYITPAAGEHSVNVRVRSLSAGTLSVDGGAGGASANLPIVVTIEVA